MPTFSPSIMSSSWPPVSFIRLRVFTQPRHNFPSALFSLTTHIFPTASFNINNFKLVFSLIFIENREHSLPFFPYAISTLPNPGFRINNLNFVFPPSCGPQLHRIWSQLHRILHTCGWNLMWLCVLHRVWAALLRFVS